MKLVYLLIKLDNEKEVENYSFNYKYYVKYRGQPIKKTINKIENVFYVVAFNSTSESLEAAHDLSDLNSEFINKFSCKCIADEASAFFNRKLYPLMNGFERILREYIYFQLQISISRLDEQLHNESDKVLKKDLQEKRQSLCKFYEKKPLEEMDFTEIYTKLFIDTRFCDQIKQRFFPENSEKKATAYKVTKDEYLEYISSQQEHIIWTDLTEGKLENIKKNYKTIKTIRNDIMHAHNINFSTFIEAKELLESVIKSLNNEINQLIKLPEPAKNIDGIIDALKLLYSIIDDISPDWLNSNKDK